MAYGVTDINLVDFDDDDYGVNEPDVIESGDDIDGEFNLGGESGTEGQDGDDKNNIFANFGNVPDGQGDVLLDYLKFNGIKDPSKIKFEDDEGVVKEVAWDDLSYAEKMNILTSSHQLPERDLEDNEINFINELRKSNMTPEQYINAVRLQALNEVLALFLDLPNFSIDDLSDDDIFILNLQDTIEDITDEEVQEALTKAKENEALFTKQMAGLRKTLKQQETMYNEQLQYQLLAQQEEQFRQFKEAVTSSLENFKQIGDINIDLDADDMEDVASFILDTDNTGLSYFGKALNDPKTLVEMAWFALKGRDAFKSITEYYNNEIKNVRQRSYEKGLEDGKKGLSKVVINKNNNSNKPINSYMDLLG